MRLERELYHWNTSKDHKYVKKYRSPNTGKWVYVYANKEDEKRAKKLELLNAKNESAKWQLSRQEKLLSTQKKLYESRIKDYQASAKKYRSTNDSQDKDKANKLEKKAAKYQKRIDKTQKKIDKAKAYIAKNNKKITEISTDTVSSGKSFITKKASRTG